MKIEKRVTEVRWMTGAELSEFLDLSPSRISQLTSEGVLEEAWGGPDSTIRC